MFTFLEHAHMSLTSMFDVTEQVELEWSEVGMFTFSEHTYCENHARKMRTFFTRRLEPKTRSSYHIKWLPSKNAK